MPSLLRYVVIFSFLFCVASLSFMVLRTLSFGKRPDYASPRGSHTKGILYAFGRGMTPWEKESARKHLIAYSAGIAYHAGIFAALLYLLFLVADFGLPRLLLVLFRLLFAVGFLAGLFLLLKRVFVSSVRKLSCPDDFGANAIIDLFLVFAALHTHFEGILPVFLLTAIVMFMYIPLGKIRHCFFFFYARVLLGRFYGGRGVLPLGNLSVPEGGPSSELK